ncbi:MAG TPA: CpsD/CapB family tyrosine-protein kinase [Chthonomonadaceae bacterium]|nr:CpsD/CapB family tyrosine-protein kinase [Chthonomonadaceae bacterium]
MIEKKAPTGTGPLARFQNEAGTSGYDANSAAARPTPPEEYAHLHADIEVASDPGQCFVVGVTSAVYGEGKTTVAMNLAGTIAQNSTQHVVLVDCNLRNWDLQTRLNLPNCPGLVDIIEGEEGDLESILQPTELDNLTIVPAGCAASNPARVVRSPRLAHILDQLRKTNAYMVVDMAPVLPVADTRVLARSLDGVVMVVRAGVTPREVAARAIDMIGSDRVLGVVLNGAESAVPAWLQRLLHLS